MIKAKRLLLSSFLIITFFVFIGWDSLFSTDSFSKIRSYSLTFEPEKWPVIDTGSALYLSLLPVKDQTVIYKSICDGQFDDVLESFVRVVINRTASVYISVAPNVNRDNAWTLFHEQDVNVLYQTTYAYIQDYFRKRDVKNVTWVYESSLFPSWYRDNTRWDYFLPDDVDVVAFNVGDYPKRLLSKDISLEELLCEYTEFRDYVEDTPFFITGLDASLVSNHHFYRFFKQGYEGFLGVFFESTGRLFNENILFSLQKWRQRFVSFIEKGGTFWRGRNDFFVKAMVKDNELSVYWKDDVILHKGNEHSYYYDYFELISPDLNSKMSCILIPKGNKVMIKSLYDYSDLGIIESMLDSDMFVWSLDGADMNIQFEEGWVLRAVDYDGDYPTVVRIML
ncbi:hypothetical protein DID78_00095 [Candidatus Marinamargulisbacteria bacterium SCGC AG-343-D04]|nr:hypothetical protein DID78_00095 [Candidatus Marinamargulisbacteria bacterium SCGC AG-343-D04]